MTPRKELTSVGYAFLALNSEMVGGQKLADLDNRYGQASPVQNPRSNTLTTVDSGGNVGFDISITIGTDGLPVVSYYDSTNGDLKVAKCGNAACSSGNVLSTVDSGFNVGRYTSIAIGTDGLPVISYYVVTTQDLKVAKCGNAACSSGNTITTVDSAGWLGEYSSIAIGTDGLPVISYLDGTYKDLKVAKCGNAACSSGNTITTVDSGGDVGWCTSIAIGTDGLPVISYFDYTNFDLKVAHCGNASCSSGNTITTIDSAGYVGQFASITIGTDGLPVISYWDGINDDLKVAKCANPFCLNNWSRR
jgi:predicted regulator of Ras-like GTPase activity (Roadblock/LC7/MglB family)